MGNQHGRPHKRGFAVFFGGLHGKGAGKIPVLGDAGRRALQQVGQKYFHGEKAPLWGGITISLSDMKKAKRTVLLVSGAHKHTILHRLLTEEPHRDLPASYLKTFEHTAVFYDQMAWSGTKL